MEQHTPDSYDYRLRNATGWRQGVLLRRAGCLLLLAFFALVPMWAITFFGKPSLWMFAAGIASFMATGLITQVWVMPAMQKKFDREVRRYAQDDPREYVVLLRGFASPVLKLKSREPEPGNLMSEIAGAVPDYLASVCIGAGETIRGLMGPSSYVPLQPPDQDWIKVFAVVAPGARAIVITPNATPGCLTELRLIASRPWLLERTLVWMPYADHKGVETAWNQIRSDLSDLYSFPEYDARGVLYRPNADFSPRTSWHPKKGKLREGIEQALAEIPRCRYSLQSALAELDQQGLKW